MEAGWWTRRQRHAAALLCAVGVGVGAYALVEADAPSVPSDRQPPRSTTSEASVLGMVITQPEPTSTEAARPATPVELEQSSAARRSPTTTIRSTSTSTTARPATTAPGPTLIDPTVIENTTTTTEAPTPTTIDLSTTTTAAPTTTEAPPG